MIFSKTALLLFASAALAAASGCIIESDDRTRPVQVTPSPKPTEPPAPAFAIVDANKTMNALGGKGVGVFVEYRSGGDWHVWWTCDTDATGNACRFAITLKSTAALYDLQSDGRASTSIVVDRERDSTLFTSTTRREVHSVDFKTEAGESILLGANIDGVASPQYFFFVQDGKVNGGYNGKLTNPVYFQPNSP